jgi:hypothetical protein
MASTVGVSTSGNTLTVTTTDCDGTPTLSPNPGTLATVSHPIGSPNTTTFTYSGMPNGTFTVTVECGKMTFNSTVTIPSTGTAQVH